ncbi:Dor1-like protein [Aureococcus anophagefferens]|nr:Dor1-like protein [Aureococcus anophagefferens]
MDSDSDDASLEDEEAVGGRSRDLLSSFYGKMASDVAPPEEEEDEALDPIDREDFDAGRARWLLKTEPLPKLLERDDALCREVKSLSGDMQMLVYENYSKFIGATDTIRDMKDNVGGMEGEMTSLSAAMADIDATSAKKLAAAIADGRHGEAVTSFQAVDGVLRKYAHVPSLADIHASPPRSSPV